MKTKPSLTQKLKRKKYCDECDEALNDNKVVGCVVAEPTYEDNDYTDINHIDLIYDGCHGMCCGYYRAMVHEKIELEYEFFTNSRFSGKSLVLILILEEYTKRWHGGWQEDQHQTHQVT